MKLPLDAVKVDPELQLRDGLDMERVKAMEEFETEGGHLPPITVVGDDNLLADGHHRLYVAHTMGRVDVDAERVPGGKAEAVAVAIQRNDLATTLPLTRAQRNQGVKALLAFGWTQEQVAKATGIHRTTIADIHNALAMRGELPKVRASSRPNGGRNPKAVAVLPADVHEKLSDTVLNRIADGLDDVTQQAEMAAAVAAVGLAEPRVREAIKAVDGGMSVTDAINEYTPTIHQTPKTMSDVARQAYQRLDDFLNATMTVEGRPLDFWQVLDVIAAQHDTVSPPAINTLVDRLSEVSVRSDQYASKLRNGVLKEVTA